MTTVIGLRRVKQYKKLLKFIAVHMFLVCVRLVTPLSLAKMLHFHNLKHFILLLISSLPRYIVKSSDDRSDFFPLVINTWAGNHEVATDKGDEATAKLFSKMVILEN